MIGPEIRAIDIVNTAEMKKLLKIDSWFTISDFGKDGDSEAWILVQHADQDSNFQCEVLKILEELWPVGETKASNYALLYDRIAVATGHPKDRKPQRYGTQGACIASKWEAYPTEKPEHLDARRASVGLNTESDYEGQMESLGFCKGFK